MAKLIMSKENEIISISKIMASKIMAKAINEISAKW
jgi:hypothetical protein